MRVFDLYSPWNLDGDLPKVAGFLQGWVSGIADLETVWQSVSSGVSTTLQPLDHGLKSILSILKR